jgi:uncharacterized protein (TIGR02246 family)
MKREPGLRRTFLRTLDRHLKAVADRDLEALAPTIDRSMTLILPDGVVLRGKDAFLDFHREWFADPHWQQKATVTDVNLQRATAWVLVDYQYETLAPDGGVVATSHAVFALTWTYKHGRWVAVADQNTRSPAV